MGKRILFRGSNLIYSVVIFVRERVGIEGTGGKEFVDRFGVRTVRLRLRYGLGNINFHVTRQLSCSFMCLGTVGYFEI